MLSALSICVVLATYKFDNFEKRKASMIIMAIVIIFFFQAILELVTVTNNIEGMNNRIIQGFMLVSTYNIVITMIVTIMFFENTKFKKATIAVMIISSAVTFKYIFSDTDTESELEFDNRGYLDQFILYFMMMLILGACFITKTRMNNELMDAIELNMAHKAHFENIF